MCGWRTSMSLRPWGSLRFSVEAEDSNAVPRQRDHIQHRVDAPGRDARFVGWATDADASGGLHPFKRPDLGKWFTGVHGNRWDVRSDHGNPSFRKPTPVGPCQLPRPEAASPAQECFVAVKRYRFRLKK